MKAPAKILLASCTPRYEEFFIDDTQVMLPSVPGMKPAHCDGTGRLDSFREEYARLMAG